MKCHVGYSNTVVFLLALLLGGCIRDSNGDCPRATNTTLLFTLQDEKGDDIFAHEVDHAEVFVHNGDGILVAHTSVSKGELDKFAGARLRLQPGVYSVVVWANTDHSQVVTNMFHTVLDRESNHLVTATPVNGYADDGDPLYHAPKDRNSPISITVPEHGEVSTVAELTHAHVKLDVTVEGYKPLSPRDDVSEPLTIDVTSLTSCYDFHSDPYGDYVKYRGLAPLVDPTAGRFNRRFNIPVFGRDTPSKICITDKNGTPIHSDISLAGLLNNSIDVKKLRYLPVVVKCHEENGHLEVEVTVALPGWNEGSVTPAV